MIHCNKEMPVEEYPTGISLITYPIAVLVPHPLTPLSQTAPTIPAP